MDSEQYQQTPYSSPMDRFGSSILLLTNPANELYKLELTLRSKKETQEGNVVEIGPPLLNDKGISSILGICQSLINQVTIMSNLTKTEVSGLMDFLGDTLARDLMMNKEDYGIESNTTRDRIYFSVLSSAFITLKRAYEEGDKRFWKGSVHEIQTRVDRGEKAGILSRLNPFSK